MKALTKKIILEGMKKRKLNEDGDFETHPDFEQGKDVEPTKDVFDKDFLVSTMSNLAEQLSNKITEIKKETLMGEKYVEFKEEEYRQKIHKDITGSISVKKEDNSIVVYGLPKLRKTSDGALEIENFENEVSVLKNTAVDYNTPEELSNYIYGIILSDEIL